MATVEITTHMKVTLGTGASAIVKEYGSLTSPVEFDITNGHVHEIRALIADDYLDEVLWTTGDGNFDTFELLRFESDADVFIELRSTVGGLDQYVLLEVKADVPLILTSDDIAATAATQLGAGELTDGIEFDQCDRIQILRNVADAAGDATVHLVLFN